MKLIFCIVFASAFFALFEKQIRKNAAPLYLAAAAVSVLSVVLPVKNMPFIPKYLITQILQRGVLAGALYIIVMTASVLPNGKIKQVSMRMRAQMAVTASILTVTHNIAFGRKYFVMLFTDTLSLTFNELTAAVFSLIMIAMLIPLTITSFSAVRRKMNPQKWKKLQSLSYIFYAMLYMHIALIYMAAIIKGQTGHIFDLSVYTALYTAYFALRIAKFPAKKLKHAMLMAASLMLFAGVCISGRMSSMAHAAANTSEPAPSAESAGETGGSSYKDGTYEGKGMGYNGNIIVNVSISGGRISGIEIVNHKEDDDYFFDARDIIIEEILASQSTDVDSVSGATSSSEGIKKAVADALKNAG